MTATATPGMVLPTGALAPARKRRRRYLVPVLVALAILLAAEGSIRVVARHLPEPQRWNTPEAQVKYEQMKALSRSHETGGIVLLGTSLLDVGVDPVLLGGLIRRGLPVYDASLAGGTLETIRWWYTHVVAPLLRPKVVVYGFTSRELNVNDPDGIRLGTQFFQSPEVHHLDGHESLMERLTRYSDDVSYLFRYRTVLRQPTQALHHTTALDIQRPVISPAGQATSFVRSGFNTSPLIPAFFRQTVTYRFTVGEQKVNTVLGTITDIRASGARVLLVDMPVTTDYILLHPHGWADWAAYEHAVTTVVAATQVPEIPAELWTRQFFADPIHLNGTGATRFTELVAGPVTGLLPPPPA